MEKQLAEFDQLMRKANKPGYVTDFTLRTDQDPNLYYDLILFESKEAYFKFADSPEQDVRFRKLVELLDGEPEWHDGEIVFGNLPG